MSVAMAMVSEMAGERPEEILGLLREQSVLYGRLESFAARQRSLVRAEETAPLLSLLADRQRLSVELTRLARRLEPVRRGWSAFRERFTAAQREEADGLISEVTRRLRKVIESDEKDARVLSVRKQSVASSLQATHSVGQAISAYRLPAGAAAGSDRLDEAS
jgi:hypothetical protein